MKCLHCKNEFEAKRNDAMFCSNKCRAIFSRLNATNNELNATIKRNNVADNQDVADKIVTDNVTDNKLKKEYEEALDAGRESPDNSKVIAFLERTPLEDLQEAGIFVPNWKRNGDKYPRVI